jgi:hypothetical protein
MRYEVFQSVGDVTTTKEYEGSPEEINQLIMLQTKQKQKTFASDIRVNVDGSDVARQVKQELDKQFIKLDKLYQQG